MLAARRIKSEKGIISIRDQDGKSDLIYSSFVAGGQYGIGQRDGELIPFRGEMEVVIIL